MFHSINAARMIYLFIFSVIVAADRERSTRIPFSPINAAEAEFFRCYRQIISYILQNGHQRTFLRNVRFYGKHFKNKPRMFPDTCRPPADACESEFYLVSLVIAGHKALINKRRPAVSRIIITI